MKSIYKHLFLSALILMASSCEDDFLDRYPETSIGTENFFNTEEDLEIYINNMYDFPGIDLYVQDNATDNAATTGNTEIKSIMASSAPSSATITGGWDWNKLRTINLFLENFDRANISEARLKHYEGLARFFRARFYVEKVKRYSDVPWYDQTIESDNEELLHKERDPRTLVVEKIMEDFEFAAAHVNVDTRLGAVNNWVVKTYYARFALYEGTFRKYHPELNLQETSNLFLRKAVEVSADIMKNGGFSIFSSGNPEQDYLSLFSSTQLSGNPEIILARAFENDLLSSGWWGYMFGNYEVSPTKDLLQSYHMADGSFYSNELDYETKLFVEEFENRDPRLSQTYAFPGFELINTSTYAQGGGIYVQQLSKNFTGYHQIKGFLNTTDQTVFNSLDVPVLRFAEVLLSYAEAKAELGELTQMDLDNTINKIRNRVNLPALSLNTPIDPVQQGRYPGLNASTGQWEILLEIRRERRVELALEGYRFDDLMRWNAGKLLEVEPEGIYFPGLGNYDLTGDGVDDIKLIPVSESIPTEKEVNSLGKPLIYYRAGEIGEDAGVYLKEGTSGNVQTARDMGNFVEPKYYYRPIPQNDVKINPKLNQIFGWD